MEFYCFTVADSVEFLDLAADGFHETRVTTPVYALDLSVAPRRYRYLSNFYTRDQIIAYLRKTHEDGNFPPVSYWKENSFCSSRKLIRVSRSPASDMSAFFKVFIANALESLSRKSKSEIFCLKYVKAYCRYVEKSIMDLNGYFFQSSMKMILTSVRTPIVYDRNAHSFIIDTIKLTAASKLITMLFENVCTNSSFVAGIFRMVLVKEDRMKLLFMNEARVTEYLLNHLKKEKYNIRHIFEALQECQFSRQVLRSNPEHLLVFLNYGSKIKFDPYMKFIRFIQFYPSYYMEMYTGVIAGEWSDLKPREEAILEIFNHFFTLSVPQFTIYLKSLGYIWRSIPNAFLSYNEMRILLLKNADTTSMEDACNKLQKWNFDSFDTIPQPRSLAHYSRCVLRDMLKRNSQLPEGIQILDLPSELKSYLRLER